MKLFLGVDGGQSSTVALIADEGGRVLGSGRGGPCNHAAAAEGRAKFARAMAECLGEALAQAGLDAGSVSFEAACLGFSGGAADKDAYSRESIRSKALKITTDAEIALTGATGGKPGIIVIAGTGSIALGRNAAGRLSRAGGWGYIFGDEGGAFDIVRRALRAALAMEEGWGTETSLRAKLLAASGAVSANALMHEWYNALDRVKVARLAPVVDGEANREDAVSREILTNAGRELAALVMRVYGTIFEVGDAVAVAYIGGVFRSDLLTLALKRFVHEAIGYDAAPPILPPAAGALLEAFGLTGVSVRLTQLPAVKG